MALCDYCQELDLDSSAARRRKRHYSLGTRRRLHHSATRDPRCPFCELIWAASHYNIYAWDAHVGITWTDDGFYPDQVDLSPDAYGARLLVPIVDSGTPGSPKAHARAIDASVAPKTLKRWFDLCDKSTGGNHLACQHRPPTLPTGSPGHQLQRLRLYKISANTMEDYAPGTDYAILSYVIGDAILPSYTARELDDYERTKMPLSEFPNTYLDAIAVAKDMNLDHLWIDAVCLPTTDPEHALGIRNMDRIYEGAAVTIVAADGSDGNSRIAAMHPRSLDTQTIATLPSGDRWTMVTGVHYHMHFLKENYPTRGWTFQEFILSHRCVVFVDGLAFWLCRARMFSEETFWDRFDDDEPSGGMLTTPYRVKFLPRALAEPWATYFNTLWRYRLRNLSRDADAVNAYQGVLNRITRAAAAALRTSNPSAHEGQLWGMPQVMLDMCLIWYHRPDMNVGRVVDRIRGPSWSWAGWKGGVVTNFLPTDGAAWFRHHARSMPIWYTNDGSDPSAYSSTLKPADTGFTTTSATPPDPAFDTALKHFFLQIYTHRNTDAVSISFDGMGVGRIRTQAGTRHHDGLLGLVYADHLQGDDNEDVFLAWLGHAPAGDPNFDFEITVPSEDRVAVPRAALSAKDRDVRFVLLLALDPRGFYRRRGLGFVPTSHLGWIAWQEEWMVVA